MFVHNNTLQSCYTRHICDPRSQNQSQVARVFVATLYSTLYGSKLSIFLLCQKSLGYYCK